MGTHEVEILLDAKAAIGEAPLWSEATGEMIWIDVTAGEIHRYHRGSGTDRCVPVGQEVGTVALWPDQGLLVGARDGFLLLDEGDQLHPVAPVEGDQPQMRMNDGKPDPAGRMWVGTVPFATRSEPGTLYRLDRDLSIWPMLSDITLSNGMGWSPKGTTFYFIDSLARRVDAFDFDPQADTLGERRVLCEVPQPGIPDGLTVDAEGCVWVAVYGGGEVRRISPAGEVIERITMPVSQPTCPAFGGPNLDELYITSAAQKLDSEELAGGLFRCRPGVVGLPPNPFAGQRI